MDKPSSNIVFFLNNINNYMQLYNSLLEEWMRKFYFTTLYDLGSSGVRNFSIKELLQILDIQITDLNDIKFDDSKTFGNCVLRQGIANRWGNGDMSTVLVGNGSNEVIFFLLYSLLLSGDEVIVLSPIYHTLGKLCEGIGCNVKKWQLDSYQNFYPNLEDLEKLISKKTKMVVVNFPHNPTGVSISKNELIKLINIVSDVNAYLLWDAAFEDIVFFDNKLPNPYLFYNKSIYIGTLSKSYGLAGLRVGWCITDPGIIGRCYNIKDYTSLYVSPINEYIALQVINNTGKVLDYVMPSIKGNYLAIKSWLKAKSNILKGKLPDGGVSAFLKIQNCRDTQNICKKLAIEHKVLTVPGICFDNPEYIRIGFGCSQLEFDSGLEILSRVLSNLQ